MSSKAQETVAITSNSVIKSPQSIKQNLLNFWEESLPQFRIWLCFRIGLFLVPIITLLFFSGSLYNAPNPKFIGGPITDRILGGWSRWDALIYFQIAQHGYSTYKSISFYPFFPHLLRSLTFLFALGNLSYVSLAIVGIIFSSVASLLVCILLYQLGKLDYSPKVARLSILYLLNFPVAFFLFAVYSESFFLALAMGAFYAARKNCWLLALGLTTLAVLTKNQGAVLAIALLAEYGRQIGWKITKVDIRVSYFALPVIALGGWLIFNAIAYHDALEFMTANKIYWKRETALPWQPFIDTINLLNHPSLTHNQVGWGSNLLDFVFAIVYIILFGWCIWLTWKKRLRLSYLLFFAGCFIQPLFLPIIFEPLASMSRYGLIIFPIFFVLADIGSRHRLFQRLYFTFALPFSIFLLFGFSLGYWVA